LQEEGNDEREIRAARNQATFRAANEKLREIVSASGECMSTSVIACECADVTCVATIEIEETSYNAIRSNPRRFAVLPGHIVDDVEFVAEEFDTYVVVEKVERAAEFVEANDPRRS
jgi:hypothetical protein